MAMFFIGIGQLLADFGIGSAIVQSRTDDDVVLSSCFWLNVAVAGVLAFVVLCASPLIAQFYRREDLAPLVAALSLNLLLSGLQVMPNALLYRDMRFAELARAQVCGSLSGALAAVGMAAAGAGVWALVAQPLVGTSVNLLLCWLPTRWLPKMTFDRIAVAPLVRFSASLLGTNIIGYGNRNVDALLIGRVLGAVPLGHYAMAIQLMLYPLQQISSVIVRVLFPTLVQIQHDLPRLRNAYLKAVATISLLTFPLMGGLFVLAKDLVLVVFGNEWAPMVPVLRVLAWVGLMQSVGTTMGTIYLSTGHPDSALKVTLIGSPILILGMASGLPWGIVGVAIGYALASASLFYYTAITGFRLIDLRLRDFHAVLARPLCATIAMIATLIAFNAWVQLPTGGTRLAAGVGVGALTYLLFSLAVNMKQLRDLIQMARSLRGPQGS
jgi:O-antigen/teichoic acid export membrane protein